MLPDLSYKGFIFFTLVVYAFCNRIAEIKFYDTDYAFEMHLKGLPYLTSSGRPVLLAHYIHFSRYFSAMLFGIVRNLCNAMRR